MQPHRIVSREDGLEARKAHLRNEKALTRMSDMIAAERRALPWVKVDKDYVFDTLQGRKTLAGLSGGNSQLIGYHFMLGPGREAGCPGCSFLADHIDSANPHPNHHDVSLVVRRDKP